MDTIYDDARRVRSLPERFQCRGIFHRSVYDAVRRWNTMVKARIIAELQKIVGKDNVATEKQDLICYSYDATQVEFLPDVVVFPANADQVSFVLRL
jgi:hypothetical protein